MRRFRLPALIRALRERPLALPLVLLLVLPSAPSAAQDAARPRYNASFVPDDDEATRAIVLAATRAAENGAAAQAADRLQTLLLGDAEGVVSLLGRQLFTSPRRWAQIMLLGERAPFGPEVLAAWRAAHDAEANGAIAGAISSGDESGLLDLLNRYPAATDAPLALYALCDRALHRGDRNAARGHLLRLPEHVARTEEDALRASKAFEERHAYLERLGEGEPEGWPTPGGASHRCRTGDPIPEPAVLTLLWEGPVLDEPPPVYVQEHENSQRDFSPPLPFDPVLDARHVYAHLGDTVAALDRRTGKILFYAPGGTEGDAQRVGAMLLDSPGPRAPTIHNGVLYFERTLFGEWGSTLTANELVAFDVERRTTLWVRRGGEESLPSDLFFRGAPAIEGNSLFVYGAVRTQDRGEPTRRESAHVFCFDRRSGALRWSLFLGYGDSDAAPSLPPLSGLAPAVSRGVVVVASGLGVAAALDARTGEVLWLFRYDRLPVREGARLSEETEERVHLRSSWLREPPRIRGDRVLLAPFDGEELYACWLRGERRGEHGFFAEQWAKHRARGHRHSILESIAGIHGGRVICCGRRDPHHAPASYQAVVGTSLESELDLAYATLPAIEREPGTGRALPPEIFGRPTLAGDVLLVPTTHTLFRFSLAGGPGATIDADGERIREFGFLVPLHPEPREVLEGERPVPAFGTLVAVEGFLFVATLDRVLCYGRKP